MIIRKELKLPINNIEKIIQISDIHIRKIQRHKEYQQVFSATYKKIREIGTKNAVIYVAGDLVHTKIDVSNEQFDITSKFLEKLASLAPVIIIKGNHDCLISNKSRLDSISPIVKNLKNANIFYLNQSGIYSFNDIDFFVWQFDEKREHWPKPKESTAQKKILFYHGVVNTAKVDSGYGMRTGLITEEFDGFNYVMLGDIHRWQTLQEHSVMIDSETMQRDLIKPLVIFGGSLIQQNYGEAIDGHGILEWNINDYTYKLHEIDNDYVFYNMKIVDGLVPNIDDLSLAKYANIKLNLINTPYTAIKDFMRDLKLNFNVVDLLTDSNFSAKGNRNREELVPVIGDLIDINYQNQLIDDFVGKYYGSCITQEIKDLIKTINERIFSQIEIKDIKKKVTWVLKKLEFSNLFAYGEGNVIDFSQIDGVAGIFGENSVGKSSVVDILEYALFDKCSRAAKIIDIINTRKRNFHCKIQFEVNNVDYFIERLGQRQKTKDGKEKISVTVNFWSETKDGIIVDLSGEQRRASNAIIRDFIGNIENLELTSISTQRGSSNFIDKVQFQRKDLLSNFMNIDVIYESLWKLANNESKENSAILKNMNEIELLQKLKLESKNIRVFTEKYSEINEQYEDLKAQIQLNNDHILELTKKIILVDTDIADIKELEEEKLKLEAKIIKFNKEQLQIEEQKTEILQEAKHFKDIVNNIDVEDLNAKYEELGELKDNLADKEKELSDLQIHYDHKKKTLDKLANLEYDPNCSYCMNNIFVKDAIIVKEEFANDGEEMMQTIGRVYELKMQIEILANYDILYIDYNNAVNELNKLNQQYKSIKQNEELLSAKIELARSELKTNISNINFFELNKKAIESNKLTQKEITIYNDKIKQLDIKLSKKTTELREIHSNKKVAEKNKEIIESDIKKIQELKEKQIAYDCYLRMVSRDGIPYELITKILPVLEHEANNVLEQIVDFKLIISSDEGDVDIYINYHDGRGVWPIELCGGLERFVSSIALRVALINISNVPRSNFLIIDEGFGVADNNNLNKVSVLLQYLKDLFDFIMIISHIDLVRDFADVALEVHTDDTDSIINYE